MSCSQRLTVQVQSSARGLQISPVHFFNWTDKFRLTSKAADASVTSWKNIIKNSWVTIRSNIFNQVNLPIECSGLVLLRIIWYFWNFCITIQSSNAIKPWKWQRLWHVGCTSSHSNTEVEHHWTKTVLELKSAWEILVPLGWVQIWKLLSNGGKWWKVAKFGDGLESRSLFTLRCRDKTDFQNTIFSDHR